jgi:hypothetical protein
MAMHLNLGNDPISHAKWGSLQKAPKKKNLLKRKTFIF